MKKKDEELQQCKTLLQLQNNTLSNYAHNLQLLRDENARYRRVFDEQEATMLNK